MTTTKLLPHKTYKLKNDVTNPHPDRRKRDDWRAEGVWKRGTRFRARSFLGPGRADNLDRLELSSGRWQHQCFIQGSESGLFELIAAELEWVDDFEALLSEIDSRHSIHAEEILEALINRGTVTDDDVRALAVELEAQAKEEE